VSPGEWPTGPAFEGEAARRVALSGKVVVITGASRGLGAGMAAHCAAAGIHLGLCARHRPEMVAKTRPRVNDGHVEPPEPPLVASVDVADFDALAAFADAVVGRFGRIDLWVNNAGLLEPMGPLIDADPVEVARHTAVNVNGVLFGSMLFARHVAGRDGVGVLVNISSGAATRPYAGWAAYCAGKAAVDRLSEVVSLEERRHGLRVHAVAPGIVDTDMQAAIRATDADRFPEVDRFRRLKEAGAFNSPAWVAEKVLELAFGDHPPLAVHLRVPDEPERPG
jgi:NAD(P)-dependent dehydrogenase (short-subunit alcohol dehydrogenase family)